MIKRTNLFILDIIYLICLLLVTVLAFTVFNHGFLSISFWMNLMASYVAITALCMYVRFIMQNIERFKRFVPGYAALGTVIVVYFICVLVYSLLSGSADFVLRWFILLHIVTIAIAVILCGAIIIYIRSATGHEEDEQMKRANVQLIENALQQILHTMEHHSILTAEAERKTVESLIELVKYSDPITPDSLKHNDYQILKEIELMNSELASQYASGELVNTERLASQLSQLKFKLKERNQLIITSKS